MHTILYNSIKLQRPTHTRMTETRAGIPGADTGALISWAQWFTMHLTWISNITASIGIVSGWLCQLNAKTRPNTDVLQQYNDSHQRLTNVYMKENISLENNWIINKTQNTTGCFTVTLISFSISLSQTIMQITTPQTQGLRDFSPCQNIIRPLDYCHTFLT